MFPRLFAPLRLKAVTLRNRIVSTPHSDGLGEGGRVTDALIAYFRAKAVGGAGLGPRRRRRSAAGGSFWITRPTPEP